MKFINTVTKYYRLCMRIFRKNFLDINNIQNSLKTAFKKIKEISIKKEKFICLNR